MNNVYAMVKRYAQDENEFADFIYKPNDHDAIYHMMMELTDGDYEISSYAASWCELATVGEIYEFREGEIEIMEID